MFSKTPHHLSKPAILSVVQGGPSVVHIEFLVVHRVPYILDTKPFMED